MIEKLKFIGAIVFVVVAYGSVGYLEEQDENKSVQHYCEMRKIWEQSKDILPQKRPGWPNFKPEIDCGV